MIRNTDPASLVLASASPRRRELLESAGIAFSVAVADIDESPQPGEEPVGYVLRLAEEKARAASLASSGRWFIGADTIVVFAGEILGKPVDAADARRMLLSLSGSCHEVITGYAVFDRLEGRVMREAVRTEVTFAELGSDEIDAYIATGCPFDKAGAYAIQGGAAYMVQRIDGSYTNVVGLPLCEVVATLRVMGAVG